MAFQKTNLLYPIKKKNLALVLSGGSARALAHIGVLEVLEENKIPIDAIVGTSMGAAIGGIYAAGKLKEFKEEIVKLSQNKLRTFLWSLKFKNPNSDSEKSFGPFLDKFIKNKKIEDLAIDFTAIAINLKDGEEVYINKGSLKKAILASVAIPGIFHCVEIGSKCLIDGGLVDPLPQRYGHIIAKKVIAVNAMPRKIAYKRKKQGIFEVLSEASGIISNTLIDLENVITLQTFSDKKGLFLQLKTENRKPFDFYNISKIINIGRREAKNNIKKIIGFARED